MCDVFMGLHVPLNPIFSKSIRNTVRLRKNRQEFELLPKMLNENFENLNFSLL